MSPGERRDLRTAIWTEVLILDEQVARLAENRGAGVLEKYYGIRNHRYRNEARDFTSAALVMLGTIQAWLEKEGFLLSNQEIRPNYGAILLSEMEMEESQETEEIDEESETEIDDEVDDFDGELDEL
jgi:hypothetical protein